jgi:hypothetical protein
MGGTRPLTTIRRSGGERDSDGIAYLLSFVEAVDFVKEDDRLSGCQKVRAFAGAEALHQPFR